MKRPTRKIARPERKAPEPEIKVPTLKGSRGKDVIKDNDVRNEAPVHRDKLSGEHRFHFVENVDVVPIYFRKKESAVEGKDHIRWYYTGAMYAAFMEVFVPGSERRGDVRVHISSIASSEGTWFKSITEAEAFIAAELKRNPNRD